METSNTYNIYIYVGLKEGYDGCLHGYSEVIDCLKNYCNKHPFCFSVTPTTYVHTSGVEEGVIVGIISYPRFPRPTEELEQIALDVAELLRTTFKQYRVTVGFPNRMIMLGDK